MLARSDEGQRFCGEVDANMLISIIEKRMFTSPHLPIPPLKWYPLPKNEVPIMEEKIIAITNEMAEVLNIAQLKKLQEVLVKAFTTEEPERKPTNHEYLRLFLEAKSIEGCSPRTLQYYEVTVQHLFAAVNLPVRKMTTERMREYLSDYQQRRNCSKATIDNIRRNISSFFSWMEEEDHILKSPMRRIHKIKTKKTVKPGFPRIHTSLTLTIRPETLGNIEFNCIFTCHLAHSVV